MADYVRTIKVYIDLEGEAPINGVTPTKAEVWFSYRTKTISVYVNGVRGTRRERVWEPTQDLLNHVTDLAVAAMTDIYQQGTGGTP